MSAPPGPQQQQPQQQQQQQSGTPAPATTPAQQAQGLPPTGIDQQLATVNATSAAAASATGQQPTQQQPSGATGTVGSTSIQQLARNLAQQYGLNIGRGNLVDEHGNFLMTPDQMSGSSQGHGQGLADNAAKMNYISSAIANQQNREQQQKGIAAIQTGLGQVQKRGRGSLASLQTGLYQDLADLYTNQDAQTTDFSYYIQQGMFYQAQHTAHRARKSAKKTARYQMIGSAIGAAAGFL